MKLILIEDEEPALKRLQKLVKEIEPDAVILGTADSIHSAVTLLSKVGAEADLILMDIELADGQSFDIFNKITVGAPVIFTTAYDNFALQAFKLNSIDYLLKPIDKEELERAMKKFRLLQPRDDFRDRISGLIHELTSTRKSYKTRFLVKSGTRLHSISVADIAYFEARVKMVWLYTAEGKRYAIDHSLDELTRMLDPELFFQINRQYLARISSVADIHTYFNGKLKITLDPPVADEVIVSREKAGEFRKWLDG